MAIPKLADILATPEKWTKGAFARDKLGASCSSGCVDLGVCWCLDGAAFLIASMPGAPSLFAVRSALWDALDQLHGRRDVWQWQDAPERTHADVLAVAKRADELIAERIGQ